MLTLEEKEKIKQLPGEYHQYILAKFSTPIKDLSDYDLEMGCYQAVKSIMDAYGSNAKNLTDVIKNIYTMLVKDLRRPKYANIAFAEIEEACYRGVRKEFGDFFAPNLSVIIGWIDAYLRSKERLDALNQFVLKSKEEHLTTSEKPLHLKINESKQGCINAFNDYKNTGRLPLCSFAYYDVLVGFIGIEYNGIKTLITDQEVRKAITKEQTDKFRNRYLEQKVKSEKKGDLLEAEVIMAKILNLDKDGELHRRIKEAFLKHYFDGLIKSKTDLEI